jgi:hypothetical protein
MGRNFHSEKELDDLFAQYRTEVLRWNRQFNLIGRKDPTTTLQNLVTRYRCAIDTLVEPANDGTGKPPLVTPGALYCDIGSGAGLPGLIWHATLGARGFQPTSCLIEPRQKRAWFLKRVIQRLELRDVEVFRARWGETAIDIGPKDNANSMRDMLLSISALRISDSDLLAGFERSFVGRSGRSSAGFKEARVIAVRFRTGEPLARNARSGDGRSGEVSEIGPHSAVLGRNWSRRSYELAYHDNREQHSLLLVSVFTANR